MTTIKKCAYCGDVFETKYQSQKYCSKEHKDLFYKNGKSKNYREIKSKSLVVNDTIKDSVSNVNFLKNQIELHNLPLYPFDTESDLKLRLYHSVGDAEWQQICSKLI